MRYIGKFLIKFKEFWDIAEIGEIARRYFVLNVFDGVLVTLGILIASFFARIYDPNILITACVGAAIAIAVSGISGGYLTEKAEREGKVKELGKKISLNLKKSPVGRAHRFASVLLALINGLSPLVAVLVIITPFFLGVNINLAYYASIAISFFILFLVGMFLGSITREGLVLSGIRMLVVGMICAIIIFLIEKI